MSLIIDAMKPSLPDGADALFIRARDDLGSRVMELSLDTHHVGPETISIANDPAHPKHGVLRRVYSSSMKIIASRRMSDEDATDFLGRMIGTVV